MKDFISSYKNISAIYLKLYKGSTEIRLRKDECLRMLKSMKLRCNSEDNKVTNYIFNRLMSDTRCLSKIVFVTNPNYRNHLITEKSGNLYIEIYLPGFKNGNNEVFNTSTEPDDSLKAFKRIISEFDVIFIKVDEDELLKELLFSKEEEIYIFKV